MMVVAYYFPHNDGTEYGIFDEPGESTNLTLVDIYEVDGVIRTFETVSEAETWLLGRHRVKETDIEPNRLYSEAE
jgi:hypothetical protein